VDTVESLIAFSMRGRDGGAMPEVEARHHVQSVAHSLRGVGFDASEDGTGRGTPIIPQQQNYGWCVRRLTPTECERLQGFPDGWTDVPWRKGRMPDGRRYKMLGNSMAVNVMRWLGRRIAMVEGLL
jgi:DNA (cytosine-5)-methyltransferase 1